MSEPKEKILFDHLVCYSGIMRIKNGSNEDVMEFDCEQHFIRTWTRHWNEDHQEWEDGEDDYLDHFYLTQSNDGIRFEEEDLEDHFWSYDYLPLGVSDKPSDWDNATNKTEALRLWVKFKNSFPRVTTKDQIKLRKS